MVSEVLTKLRANATLTSRMMLLTVALGSAGMVAHRAADWFESLRALGAIGFIATGVGVALGLSFLAVRARADVIKAVAREVVLIGAVLLAVEVLLVGEAPEAATKHELARNQLMLESAAQKFGIPFDRRTVSQVVEDLRDRGVDALPGLSRAWPRASELRPRLADGFYPLSDASNAAIVECNEGGEYMVFRTDEFGFNNPAGLVAAGRPDVAVVGESHALGHCVAAGHGFVDVVRNAIPRTVNFALSYTFALSQLGSFREYVEPLKPPVVLWVVSPQMATTADTEPDDPTLRSYLNPAFSQDLMNRQDEVDAIVRAGSQRMQAAADAKLQAELDNARSVKRFARVYALRRVRSRFSSAWHHAPPPPDTAMFEQSLRLAADTTKGWGGRLVVMILPSYGELMGERKEVVRRRAILNVVGRLNVDVIDAEELFARQPDVPGLFTLQMQNHPNVEGHALLGDWVAEKLKRRLDSMPKLSSSDASSGG